MANNQCCSVAGFYFEMDGTGRNTSNWSAMGWYYNGVYYPSGDAFRQAYTAGELAILPTNMDGPWTNTDQAGEAFAFDERAAPVLLAPQGKRYAVDEANRYVEWDAFSFYLSYEHDRGLALFDVRYDGATILYELGLQEALAHYAGQDPTQSLTCYLDSAYGIGPDAYQMVAGYDCPPDAYYFNATTYFSEITVFNQVCSANTFVLEILHTSLFVNNEMVLCVASLAECHLFIRDGDAYTYATSHSRSICVNYSVSCSGSEDGFNCRKL